MLEDLELFLNEKDAKAAMDMLDADSDGQVNVQVRGLTGSGAGLDGARQVAWLVGASLWLWAWMVLRGRLAWADQGMGRGFFNAGTLSRRCATTAWGRASDGSTGWGTRCWRVCAVQLARELPLVGDQGS